MVDLQETADGVIVPVRAQPGARKNAVTGIHAGQLKVSVTQAPEKGKANLALIEVLSEALEVPRSKILLVSGATSGQKKFCVVGGDLASIRERIVALTEK
jgi:uncharacterized protein (TIGR00251 family)